MDLIDQLRAIAVRINAAQHLIQTEEATKNAMIMPFIQALGYNVFDPAEVTPELIADIGTKKGEKVDYAILKDNKPIILFECKKCGNDLHINHASQLFRYFHVTEARFGVLTNGTTYHFFTDLDQPNKMDEKPFLEFNILNFKEQDVIELKKFTKSAFDIDIILTTANELKYTRAIQNELASQMNDPTEDFVRLIAAEFISGKRFNLALKDQFTQITKRAFQQLISDRINDRLKVAMTPNEQPAAAEINAITTPEQNESQITTTPEEVEGFYIIKAILRDIIPSKRITMRDAQSYCAILLDDNNRKPICRLRFNNSEKLVIGIMNGRDEEKISLAELDDIYFYSEKIRSVIQNYNSQ